MATENTKPIIGYWKIRGLAAPIHYQLAYSKVDFDQEIYEQGDAPDFSRASWMDVKYTQNFDFPNLPYLKHGNYSLTESVAIHKYCAKKWCPELLCLDDDELYGKAEMSWAIMMDAKMAFTMPCYMGDGDKKAHWEKCCPRLESISKFLEGKKFMIGDRLCCADFQMAELVDLVDFISDGEVYKVYPNLKAYKEAVFALPGVKDFTEKSLALKFNNKSAKINN
eukprot:CAMPEP_0171388326 /NCGR_PEP_ID=MMETSP0879-20121228/40451_1 /TAXON_ID=67004 /ORGANISM="Thalassiosira weissflogii, Strain CCMP1336" /LENGTH=222 /DNA_ID=CAMNT_0011900673 /DNA_START=39 /DNA_END=707 /DNA_ORIENTATION=+